MKILEQLNIHITKPLSQRIPVAEIERQLEATNSDKKLLESHIASIYLIGILDEKTTRIRAYVDNERNYQSIYVLEIELKQDKNLAEVNRLIHSAFPNALIIVYKFNKKNLVSVAEKRINKNDNTKTVIEDIILTEVIYIDELKPILIKLDEIVNLYNYYQSVSYCLGKIFTYNKTGIVPSVDFNYKEWIANYNKLNTDINKLKEQYKKANMLAEKIQIDDEICDKEEQIRLLMKEIKGGLD